MNSNRFPQLLGAAVVGGALVIAAQMPWQRKLRVLEQEVVQLQTRITEQHQPAAIPALAEIPRPSWSGLNELMNHAAQNVTNGSEGRSMTLDELAQLTDDQLDQTVAGAGVPPPGPVAVTGAMPASPGEPEQTASQLVPRVEKGGVLLPKGKMQIEPTITYSHISSDRVGLSGFSVFDVVFIGQIKSDEVDRDIIAPAVSVRYGLTNSLQAEVELPSQFRREESISGPVNDKRSETSTEHGLGDMTTGLFWQFAHQQGARPNMIAMMKVKAPTGSEALSANTWGVKTGLVMVKNSDPVVLFSNVGYTMNLPADINGLQVNPGNSFEYSAGMAYALNYNLALNGSFEQIFIGETSAEGSPITGSRLVVANFKTGLTYAFTRNFSMDFSVGTGLTEDSPDVTVSVSFPYTF